MSNAANTLPAIATVSVRDFRSAIERVENYVHGHIHSTTTFAELSRWSVECASVLARLRGVSCKRANAEDRERFMITVARADRALLDVANGTISRKVTKPALYIVR